MVFCVILEIFRAVFGAHQYDLDDSYKVEAVYDRKRQTAKRYDPHGAHDVRGYGKDRKKLDKYPEYHDRFETDKNEEENRFYYGGIYQGRVLKTKIANIKV